MRLLWRNCTTHETSVGAGPAIAFPPPITRAPVESLVIPCRRAGGCAQLSPVVRHGSDFVCGLWATPFADVLTVFFAARECPLRRCWPRRSNDRNGRIVELRTIAGLDSRYLPPENPAPPPSTSPARVPPARGRRTACSAPSPATLPPQPARSVPDETNTGPPAPLLEPARSHTQQPSRRSVSSPSACTINKVPACTCASTTPNEVASPVPPCAACANGSRLSSASRG